MTTTETIAARAPRRGRPARFARAEREALILEAMEQVVAAAGLPGASMAAIADAAGMSKRTLYACYGSRDALFEAWVRHVRASFVRPLPADAGELPIAERLRLLLRREVSAVTSERRRTVLRAIIAEAPRAPELASAFLREGPHAGRALVAQELARGAARGEISAPDPEAMARLLCDMAHSSPLDCLLDPHFVEPDPQEAEARLAWALDIFLNGARPRPATRHG